MALVLVVNGRERSFDGLDEGAALDEVVAALGLKSDRVAVELRGEIVPRAGWPAAKLSAGDKLEVVHFVGGGAGDSAGRFRDQRSAFQSIIRA